MGFLRDAGAYVGVVLASLAFAALVATVAGRIVFRRSRTCWGGFIAPPISDATRAAMRVHVADMPDVDVALDDPLVSPGGAAYLRSLHDLPARLPAHEAPPGVPGEGA